MPLDIAAYPHILDSVLELSGAPTLLALRGTCRELRRRVDSTLGHHVVFMRYADEHARGKDGPAPFLYNLSKLHGDELTQAFQHTRIADVVGPPGLPDARCREIADAMSLEILRLRHHPSGRPPSSVPFVAPTLITLTTFIDDGLVNLLPVAEVGTVSDGVEHFVLNLRYDPGRSWMPQAHVASFARPASLKTVTVIFTAKTTHREEEVWFRHASKPMGLLNSIVLGMAMSIPRGVRYTIVGMQTLRLEWLGLRQEGGVDDGHAVQRAITSAVAMQCKKWERYDDETAEAAAARIQFMTRDEYRDSVGEERFALETVE